MRSVIIIVDSNSYFHYILINTLEIKNMYVCVCNALNEKTVRAAAQKAVAEKSVLKIFESLGAKPQCGKCLCFAKDICNEEFQAMQAV